MLSCFWEQRRLLEGRGGQEAIFAFAVESRPSMRRADGLPRLGHEGNTSADANVAVKSTAPGPPFGRREQGAERLGKDATPARSRCLVRGRPRRQAIAEGP